MIALMRIDNRLIHGQVALLWTKHLQANRIIVANDTIVKNEVQVAALKMACPATAKCSVLSVEDSIKVLNDPRAERLRPVSADGAVAVTGELRGLCSSAWLCGADCADVRFAAACQQHGKSVGRDVYLHADRMPKAFSFHDELLHLIPPSA